MTRATTPSSRLQSGALRTHRALRRLALQAAAAAGLALAVACGGSSSEGPPAPTLTITRLGWYEENIDPSYWSSPPPGGETAFYDFFIHYSGTVAFGDIEYAHVTVPGGYTWVINRDSSYLNASAGTIGGWGRWYGVEPGVLPIGTLLVEVKLTNGVVSRSFADIPAPGSLTSSPYSSMYAEDVVPAPTGSAPMVRRAGVGSGTSTAATQAIDITFSVDDARVANGFVWFFDSAGAYLGGFFHFKDPVTGAASPTLAGGLATDGTVNTLALHGSDLTLQAGASFSRIAQFMVVLTDGDQHGLQPSGQLRYDCRSISARTPLTAR